MKSCIINSVAETSSADSVINTSSGSGRNHFQEKYLRAIGVFNDLDFETKIAVIRTSVSLSFTKRVLVFLIYDLLAVRILFEETSRITSIDALTKEQACIEYDRHSAGSFYVRKFNCRSDILDNVGKLLEETCPSYTELETLQNRWQHALDYFLQIRKRHLEQTRKLYDILSPAPTIELHEAKKSYLIALTKLQLAKNTRNIKYNQEPDLPIKYLDLPGKRQRLVITYNAIGKIEDVDIINQKSIRIYKKEAV